MDALIGAAPILASTTMILLLRQSSIRSGLAGLAVAVLVAGAVPPYRQPLPDIADAVVRGGLTTLVVAYVLFGGVLLYQVLREGGALGTISAAVTRAIPDPGHRLFTLLFGLSVFFEAVTGFGIGVVVCAPLFVALGHSPIRAALLALLGQCAIPWGALAIGTVLGGELSGVPMPVLGALGTVLSLPFIVLCGLVGLAVAGEWRPWPARLAQLAAYAGVLSAGLWAGSVWVSVELAGCLAGLLVTAVGIASGRRRPRAAPAAGHDGQALRRALTPLAVLVAALLATRLLPSVEALTRSLFRIEFTRYEFALSPVHHPGFWMVLAALTGVAALGLPRRRLLDLFAAAGRQWWLASLAVAGFLAFAQVMYEAGMTGRMAAAITAAVGEHYLLLVPWVGALGGFLTASNAGANAMLMQLQTSAAQALALPLDATAAAQNAGAANATLASPGRVVLAATVVGRPELENRLLRHALAVAAGGTAGATAVLWWLTG